MQTNSPLMPREKLLEYGVEALEDHELLAIFLRTGIKGCPVMELSHSVLQHFGSLRTLLSADKDVSAILAQVFGIAGLSSIATLRKFTC